MKLYLLFIAFFLTHNFIGQDLSRQLIVSGIEAMYEKDHIKSLELLTKAKSIAEKNNNLEDVFLAVNNIGANYYTMLDYGEALRNYLEAYEIAINHLEDFQEMVVLNNIAILYSKEKEFEQAEGYFLKAYDLAKKNSKKNKLAIYAVNIGHVYNEKNEPIIAGKYIDEAIQNIENNPRLLLEAKVTRARTLFLKGDDSIAKRMAFELIPDLINPEYKELQISLLLTISMIFQREKKYEEALQYSSSLLDDEINMENKIDVLTQVSSIYLDQKDYLKVINIKDTIFNVQKELNIIKNGRLFESSKVKFEIQNYQYALELSKEKIKAQRKTFYIILCSTMVIILLSVWILRNRFIKIKQRKLLHVRNEEILNLELEKEKTEKLLLEKQLAENETKLLLEKEKLKNEIESKNRKLSVKALYLADRNLLIESIIVDLEKSRKLLAQPLLNRHINKLKSLLQSESEWSNFLKHFEEVNQGFLSKLKLKHPNLNVNDIRFISYVYMNLSVKEISSILSITPDAARKRKERISKKLDLSKDVELYSYLSKN